MNKKISSQASRMKLDVFTLDFSSKVAGYSKQQKLQSDILYLV